MKSATEVYRQNDGEVTKAWYADMNALGFDGQLAVALFRAQKRSTAAKKYRAGKFTRAAYDVKNWSLSEICRILSVEDHGIRWGWGRDDKAVAFEWVLYVELPGFGQCSFHSSDRLQGPDCPFSWDGIKASADRILAFCDAVITQNGVMEARAGK